MPVVCLAQEHKSPYLLTIRAHALGVGDVVIDAAMPVQCDTQQTDVVGTVLFEQSSWSWPGMFAHLANDGKHGQRVNRCNCRMQMHGHLHASRRIPGLDTNKADWAASEILWDYGEGYWNDGIKVL